MIIALCGLKTAGKSTAANGLISRASSCGHTFVKLPLAGRLKKMLMAGLDVPWEAVYGNQKGKPLPELNGNTSRHAMTTLGTEWGRDCMGEDFWLDLWRRDVLAYEKQGIHVIADDVRFLNEMNVIRAGGGMSFRIDNPKVKPAEDAHRSELEVFDLPVDDVLVNDYSTEREAFISMGDLLLAGIRERRISL